MNIPLTPGHIDRPNTISLVLPKKRTWTKCGSNLDLFRSNLLAMEPNLDAFRMDRIDNNIYTAAKDLGIKVSTRKLNGNGYLVWRRA